MKCLAIIDLILRVLGMKKIYVYIAVIFICIVGCEKGHLYNLSVTVNPVGGGSVEPATGEYMEGEELVLTAMPSAEYIFSGWSGDATGISPKLHIIRTNDMNIQAEFVKKIPAINLPNLNQPS